MKNIPLNPPSKGESRETKSIEVRAVVSTVPQSSKIRFATQSVANDSPFEGGSRGMFFACCHKTNPG
jgi:hypothetical protein